MRKPIIIATLLWILATISPALADVSVRAEVDRTSVAPGESLELQVTVSGGDGEVDLSGLADFKVLSRGTSSSVQIINGKMSREVTYTYLLIPQRQGRLSIPALPVEVDGQIHRSNPITITVTSQPDLGREGAGEKEVWVTAEISNSTPYVGQQVIYTFRLVNRIQIDDAKFQAPEFDGFSDKEVKDRRSYRKIINGREHVITEVVFILTPLDAGARTIEPAGLQVGIVRQNRASRRSPFDDFFNRGFLEPRFLQTEGLDVNVLPLPPLPQGSQFSGLVGRFDLRAEIESPDLNVGDSATLVVTIEGRGNISDALPPDLQIPPAFKAYSDSPQEEIEVDHTGMHGKKVFRTALVPLQAGRFELPPVPMTYFDVDLKAYRTLTASAPALTVAASREGGAPPVSITPEPLLPIKKKVTFTGRDILPPKENLEAVQSRRPISVMLFLFGLAAPGLIFAGTVMIQRLRRRDTRPAALMKARARQALIAARNVPGQEFLTLLYQALTAAILAAGGRMGEALTWKEAETLLLESGQSPEAARQTAELLAEIESWKFSGRPLAAQQHHDLLTQTRQAIRKLVP